MAENLFIQNLLHIASAADDYREKAHKLVVHNANNSELISKLSCIPFGTDLLAGAHMYMQSGMDSFLSFRLLSLPDGVPKLNTNSDVVFRLTNNGSAVLLRRALECLVRAKWLLDCDCREKIVQRGFAVCWSNSNERVKYEKALNSSELANQEENMRALQEVGLELDLLSLNKSETSYFPKVGIQDATSLLKSIKSDLVLPDKILDELGTGFTNAEWSYRWLSGMSHGMSWAHIFNEEKDSTDVSLKVFYPDPRKFASSALFILQIAGEVFKSLESEFEVSLGEI